MRAVALAALVTLASCADLLGIEDLTLSDAGSVPPGTIAGRWDDTFHTLDGDEVVARDLTGYVIEAYIPDAEATGGYRVETGTVTENGSFTIENVPDGESVLLAVVPPDASRTVWFETDQRSVQLGRSYAGRPDAELATVPTTVSFDIDGMQPWSSNRGGDSGQDMLELRAFNTGGVGSVGPSPEPGNGATSLTGDIEWGHSNSCQIDTGARLVDSTRGDDLNLFHYTAKGEDDTLWIRLVDSFMTDEVSIIADTTTHIEGTFAAATIPNAVTVRARPPAYAAPYSSLLSSAGFVFQWLAAPYDSLDTPFCGAMIAHLRVNPSFQGSLFTRDATHSDPFDGSWNRYATIEYGRMRGVLVPGASTPAFVAGGFTRTFVPPATFPDVPDLAPPTSLELGGVDINTGAMVPFADTAIELSWLGDVRSTFYEITVWRMFEGNGLTRATRIATLRTANSAIKLPTELLAGGKHFVFVVDAIRSDTAYGEGTLQALSFPYSRASSPSALVRVDSTCGDGTPAADEACDSYGINTSTCDADCTAPACGDGIRNAAVNEACDTVGDSFGCDDDCTIPMCGDGHFNPNVEQCDDGNDDDDGNGCSGDCLANNICGDGLVEEAAEACDDANTNDADGCDYHCQVEYGYDCVGEPSVCTPTPKG